MKVSDLSQQVDLWLKNWLLVKMNMPPEILRPQQSHYLWGAFAASVL